ncbi:hypothetical protein LTR09_001237 [Extremus antarcticus]|uniref:Uncharacterized protein n=1 Tax=Extremus antarcticus TaxID=702011 RepID=A0AAJ0LWP8_9PEZI|nr:hypothetical protein LTR09_001237 [Extremus antarcticus]
MAAVHYGQACPMSPLWYGDAISRPFHLMEYGPEKQAALDDFIARRITAEDVLGHNTLAPDWTNFAPAERLAINHPWISRYASSALRFFDHGIKMCNTISTQDHEIYGDDRSPMLFRIGSGNAGYTGIFKVLCERYIHLHNDIFSIGMVRNMSRHSQVALLADVIQVALTQEPHNEDMAIGEGWCERVCPVFNDHSILCGPASNPAGLEAGLPMEKALQTMVLRGCEQVSNRLLLYPNGNGSSSFFKKHQLWSSAGIDTSNAKWTKGTGLSPHAALQKAAGRGVYMMPDRATYLMAKDGGLIPTMKVYVEGGQDLINPCSALVNKLVDTPASRAAAIFARWLGTTEAQEIIRCYGKDRPYAKPLYTVATQGEFEDAERLAGKL